MPITKAVRTRTRTLPLRGREIEGERLPGGGVRDLERRAAHPEVVGRERRG